MKKTILFTFSMLIATLGIGQNKTIKCSYSINEVKDFKTEYKERNIIITPQLITITKLLNGGKEDAKCKIDKTAEKEFNDKICIWYYCTSTVKDFINGYSKMIVIVSKSNDVIDLYTFADEVTVFHQSFHK